MSKSPTAASGGSHLVSYPKFLWRMIVLSTEGNWLFYAWMIFLSAVALVGVNAWAVQVTEGMGVTNMTDHVSWGLYIANFTFMVGLAAGGVMMVIPAYLYHDEDMHDIVIIGELLAIAAIFMCIAFVMVDLGRPDRFWHMIPGIGKFHFPVSMLTWDVIVLNGYLLINMHICGYLLYNRYRGIPANPRWYIPFVFISIAWAISIHTVTAFLYQGLGGRPFWNTALLAPRFLTSAFVSGPAFIILALEVIRYLSKYKVGDGAIKILVNIMRVTILINLLMLVSEVFTEFYTGGSHTASAKYLYFGLEGYNALVPWIWTSVGLTIVAAIFLLRPNITQKPVMLITACVLAFVGIWIEKGMGLIIPGFIPNTLHEIVEYLPNGLEWRISAGIWAAGLIIYTLAIRVAMPIFSGEVSLKKDTHA
ncbi:MAG: sulfate reduction electron transfer complex DsrMKJOP subunit DsrP [Opitutaceae bacterium]